MTSSYLLTVENPLSAELEGEVGCYNLLVRAVETAADVDIGDRSWLYVAQQLRSVDSINGSLMQMILTHRSALRSELVVTRKSYRFAKLNQSDSHRWIGVVIFDSSVQSTINQTIGEFDSKLSLLASWYQFLALFSVSQFLGFICTFPVPFTYKVRPSCTFTTDISSQFSHLAVADWITLHGIELFLALNWIESNHFLFWWITQH